MPKRSSAAIYARISQDREGSGLGVQRQLEDCRAEAARLGWIVAEEYVDDDVSAYSGKSRPAYTRMLDDIADGQRDAILTWHMDRLHRQPIELEHLLRVCSKAGVTELRTVQGAYDLGTGDGMLVARILSAMAAQESDRKRHRSRRKMLQIAQSGVPHGGGNYRPFGFESDRITHRPDEAQVVRDMAARALAGENLHSLLRWLKSEGVTTVSGGQWKTSTLRQVLINPRYYGVRTHQGQPIGPAAWAPIITPEQGEALRALLTDPNRRTNRAARRYLLSGMLRCSLCGSVMFSVPRFDERRYLCRSGEHGGCGKMAVSDVGAEQILTEAVLIRLDSPELHDAIAGRVRDDEAARALHEQIAADTTQLEELAAAWANKQITGPEWSTARGIIDARVTDAKRRLSHLAGTRTLDAYVGSGSDLRDQWETLNLDRQRAITKALVVHVDILPGRRGARGVDPDRLRPVWRL
jgi:site-specific DNA recombinase